MQKRNFENYHVSLYNVLTADKAEFKIKEVSMNRVLLVGRIVSDSKSGVFRIAINKRSKDGKEITDFIPVFVGKGKEKLEKYLTKGKLVSIDGYIHSYSKENKSELIVVAQQIEFLEKKKEEPEVIEAEAEPPEVPPW
jgi:single-stranded DNA-binding protein